jgi:hypothetical protein
MKNLTGMPLLKSPGLLKRLFLLNNALGNRTSCKICSLEALFTRIPHLKYIYKAMLANTSQNVETEKRIIIWDPSLMQKLTDGKISYNKFY